MALTKKNEALLFAFLVVLSFWGSEAFTATLRPLSTPARTSAAFLIQRRPLRHLAMSEDDDDEDGDEPLSKGIDSVSWLPSVMESSSVVSPAPNAEDTELLPLFPLGGIVYTPNSEHILNIFEPRYRQMYTDILMNGTRRFVVSMSHPSEPGRFAQTGVLFELKDLKEVSEQTKDQIKYICSHKVTRRVKLHRVLNPEAWKARDTYLRVEGTILPDDDTDSDSNEEPNKNDVYGFITAAMSDPQEKSLRKAFAKLVDIQHELEEDVRFTRASVLTLAVKPGSGNDGLWQTIRLWQSFVDQRLMARQNELQKDFQEKLQNFLKQDRGLKDGELPGMIGFSDLTPALQKEVKELQKRMAVELEPLILESTLTMQKLLEAKDHSERLKLMQFFIDAETRRLTTKRTLQGMFATASLDEVVKDELPPKENSPKEELKNSSSSTSSIFDEPDAFQ
ncbi:hypothetical protein FisN_21Lh277 [Fistulifera solaris]|uniref:Lon N-terminal domain-containing protein n=1 Tax=Fistulifera solaris TaxID=1519565 RepID=A0A1Z5KEU9_FISSO|nr:hypothetical protein FisN_21Lh277 [Fistulifera solaris]|eukprot:GAX24622.1 hypothetical protein FisN_21Lh277 [Fistulifera solaris]